MALKGVDIRTWDLEIMLAAYESALRQGAKDEGAWRRLQSQVYAEPAEVRKQRKRAGAETATPNPGRMSVGDAEALLARMAASDAMFG